MNELYLNNNRLTLVPKEMESLKQLKKLDLGNNKLTSVPKEIEDLKALIDQRRAQQAQAQVAEYSRTRLTAYTYNIAGPCS
jgi:Leucine-rich repeat (LRR) protein